MKKIAKFEKVSYLQFEKDFEAAFGKREDIKTIYDNIKLPVRATRGSAGYDFFTPIAFTLKPNETINIPTGICCEIEDSWVLQIFPRSSLGFKFRLQLNNTVGIIDSDYFHANNEGHIAIKLTNCTNENKIVEVMAGQGIAQGVFIEFGITMDDIASANRTGGFGSTDKK